MSFLHDGRVLIVKRAADDAVGRDTWETVGGKLELGEDLELALMREMMEETGLKIVVERILYATTFKTDPTRQVVIYIPVQKQHQGNPVIRGECGIPLGNKGTINITFASCDYS